MFLPTDHALDQSSMLPMGQLVQNPMQLGPWVDRLAIRYLRLMEEQILGILQ